MNVALHHFKLVDTIFKEGTLTKAAATLNLTQSALSHQLKELENSLGIEVFHRQGKRMHLSAEGFRFLKSAEKILAEIKQLEEDLQNYKNGNTGKLNVSMQTYTAYHWLPAIVKYYRKQFPDINIHIASEATRRPLEYLLRGDVDVALVRTQIVNNKVKYEAVFEDTLITVLPDDHPLAAKSQIEISDFENQELILPLYDPSYQDTPVIENQIQVQHVKPKILHRIHYTDAALEMVKAGLGITIMADWIARPYLPGTKLVTRPLPLPIARRTWYTATTRQTPAVTHFVDCLKLYFNGELEKESRKLLVVE